MTINITKAREHLYDITNKVIKNNEIVTITTKNGDAILVSAENYNSLVETLFLSSDSEYKKSLIAGMRESIDDCLSEEDIDW